MNKTTNSGQGFVCTRGNRIVCTRGDGDRLYTRGSFVYAVSICGVPKQCGHTLGSFGRCKGRVLIQGAQMRVSPHPSAPQPHPTHHRTLTVTLHGILDMNASRSERH